MLVVGITILLAEHHILQFLLRLAETWSRRVVLDVTVFQIIHPFLQRSSSHIVELVDADNVVFGEYLVRSLHPNSAILLDIDGQGVVGMYPHKLVGAVIEVVSTLSKIEINNADRIDLLDLAVGVAQFDMLRDGLGSTIEHTLQIVQLTRQLYLDEKQLATVVLSLDVNTVELVIHSSLIAFAFQEFHNMDRLIQQHR